MKEPANSRGCPYCERPAHECICAGVDSFFDDCFELLYLWQLAPKPC